MPRLTMPVDMMASARMPGTRKSTGRSPPAANTLVEPKNSSSTSGMTSVTSRFSPRRDMSRSSIMVCAARAFISVASCLLPAASRTHPVAGEAQEDVLERLAADAQLPNRQLLTAGPIGHLSQQRRRIGGLEQIDPALVLAHGVHAVQRLQLLHVQPRWRNHAHGGVLRIGLTPQRFHVADGDEPAAIDDADAIGQLL